MQDNQSSPYDGGGTALLIITTAYFSPDIREAFFAEGLSMYTDDTLDEIDTRFDNPDIWLGLGNAFKDLLAGNPYFVCEIPFESQRELELEASAIFQKVNSLLFLLWFIKDNCAYASVGGLFIDKKRSTWVNLSQRITTARKHSEATKFHYFDSIDYVQYIHKSLLESGLYTKREETYYSDPATSVSTISLALNPKIETKLDRAISFLGKARSSGSLPEKISNYVLILECLFSGDADQEIVHKISERVALYMDHSQDDPLTIFRSVKKLYSIRSKYVHGQNVYKDWTHEKLIDLSIKADDYTRAILTKVITKDAAIFTKNSKELGDWFTEMVLYKHPVVNQDEVEPAE